MNDNGPVIITPGPDSRLAQLHAEYETAKAAADHANSRLKSITDGIKSTLSDLAPEERRVDLAGNGLPTLRMVWVESWRLNAKRLKAEDPTTYVRYAEKSGTFQLRAARGEH